MFRPVLDTRLDVIGIVIHTTIVFTDDIHDTDLTNALQSLMSLFVEHILTLSADITSIIKCKVSEWIASQAAFIQTLFRDISWES